MLLSIRKPFCLIVNFQVKYILCFIKIEKLNKLLFYVQQIQRNSTTVLDESCTTLSRWKWGWECVWFTGLTVFMLKTPNKPTLELATHGLCTVIAIEYKWAEEYLLYTGSTFHPVVKTQPNGCCRHHNLREALWAKFCPFRNPLQQLWNFCGRLFCTNPVCWEHPLSTLEVPAWWASPSDTSGPIF